MPEYHWLIYAPHGLCKLQICAAQGPPLPMGKPSKDPSPPNNLVLQVRSPKGPEGGVCKVGLRLKAYPDNPIQCVASACQFKDGSGKIQCQNAQCACQQGACPGEQTRRLLFTVKGCEWLCE